MTGHANSHTTRQSGFTIIELTIATIVFSMVLLMLSTAVIHITQSYYKGITETNTQNVARAIMQTITEAVQFNSGQFSQLAQSSTWQGFCIGQEAFVYQPGWQLVDSAPNQSNHQATSALRRVYVAGGCQGQTNPATLATDPSGVELLSPNMRLSNLTVAPLANGLYSIGVNITYGDDDLLTNPTGSAPQCLEQAISHFCATSDLSTVVGQRVQS